MRTLTADLHFYVKDTMEELLAEEEHQPCYKPGMRYFDSHWVFLFVLFTSLAVGSQPEGLVSEDQLMECVSHKPPERNLRFRDLCDESGQLRYREAIFQRTGSLSQQAHFNELGQMIAQKHYNIDGDITGDNEFEYLVENRRLRRSFHLGREERVVTGQSLEEYLAPEDRYRSIKIWVFDREENYRPIRIHDIAYYSFQLPFLENPTEYSYVTSMHVLDEAEEIAETFVFHHFEELEPGNQQIRGFERFAADGAKITEYFENDQLIDPLQVIDEQELSAFEKQRRKDIFLDHTRPPILVIDTGFDEKHPDMTYKFYHSSTEIADGIDNDGNGWVDDLFGWRFYEVDGDQGSSVLSERPYLRAREGRPISHGTHVADIALQGIEEFSLTGVAGDFHLPAFLDQISAFIGQHSIRYVNMSFSFDNEQSPFAPGSGSFDHLEKLIQQNAQTLFFAAAGNSKTNLDNGSEFSKQYPASWEMENLFVIGALDTGSYDEKPLAEVGLATLFTNTGIVSVDIFAPGTRVEAADMGGGTVRLSGTSMAAPNAMNIALKAALRAPRLQPLQIKELLMKTAYIKDLAEPLPCVSGGMVYPERAFAVAERLQANAELSVEEAALAQRRTEGLEAAEIQSLRDFWSSRSL